jgi:hypothetical protein
MRSKKVDKTYRQRAELNLCRKKLMTYVSELTRSIPSKANAPYESLHSRLRREFLVKKIGRINKFW